MLDLTEEDPLEEPQRGKKRKINHVVAEKPKNCKKRPPDSKRANLAKTKQSVMGTMHESSTTRMMMGIIQMHQESQVKMQAQMQALMQMMQMMMMTVANGGHMPA